MATRRLFEEPERRTARRPSPAAVRRRTRGRRPEPLLIQHPDVTEKAFALLVLFVLATVVAFGVPALAPRVKTLPVTGPVSLAAFAGDLTPPPGYTETGLLPLDRMPVEKPVTPAGRKKTGLVTLETVREAGCLGGYSVPPGCLRFGPGGSPYFVPRAPPVGAPCDAAAIRAGNSKRPRIALTFDAEDVETPNCPELIDELTRLRVPATFFVVGGWCRNHPELLKALADRGFEIASHSYSHPWFTRISNEEIVAQLRATEQAAREQGVAMSAYIRPPFGDHDDRVRQVLASCGYHTVLWNRDTRDWEAGNSTEGIIERATVQAKNGDIVIFHTHTSGTPVALEEIVETLRARGFELTTVSGVLEP